MSWSVYYLTVVPSSLLFSSALFSSCQKCFSHVEFKISDIVLVYYILIISICNIQQFPTECCILSNSHELQALGLLFLLFSSWVAYVMFEDTQQGKTVFTSYGTTFYQMFVLFTTSNNPDVWIPAYR